MTFSPSSLTDGGSEGGLVGDDETWVNVERLNK